MTESSRIARVSGPPGERSLPIFRSFAGWRPAQIAPDTIAGLTLAAIAIPEQMATARLAGFAPEIGFVALMAGAIGFTIFGDSRRLSVGADSTIAPIFAGALAGLAAGNTHYASAAGALALLVGLALTIAGALRLGFVADLLSIPVTTGFLVGIAVHIVVSQAPAILGLDPAAPGALLAQIASLAGRISSANGWTLGIGLGTLIIMVVGARISERLPAALFGLALSGLMTSALGLEAHGVATLGDVSGTAPHLSLPIVSLDDLPTLAPLAAIVSLIVMVQTAATARAFADRGAGPDVNRDFIGVGVSNLIAGLTGAFPVDASPPRTAIVAATGGVSQLAGLVCAALALAVALFAGGLIAHVPYAALGGVLLFIALRILRVRTMVDVWKRSRAEFLLILVTATAMLALPIEEGVGVGVMLSLLQGVWTTTPGAGDRTQTHPGDIDLVARRGRRRRSRARRQGHRPPGAAIFPQRVRLSRRHREFRQRRRPAETDRHRGQCAGRDRLYRRGGARRTRAGLAPARGRRRRRPARIGARATKLHPARAPDGDRTRSHLSQRRGGGRSPQRPPAGVIGSPAGFARR